ncbi:hypothetical protein C8R45DRAFT_1084501 [Mycena sanguinolenta]|nr:hypothetical protein C8R45DRAFT_1084501 [Mycena sanguinolenta]
MHQSLRLKILSGLEPRKLAKATAAVNGSLPLLRTLVSVAGTTRDQMHVLPVFYHHLDPTKIPSDDEMDMEILPTDTADVITRAHLCMEGLCNYLDFPPGSQRDLWERVWPWARFFDVHPSRVAGAPTQDIVRAHIFNIIMTVEMPGPIAEIGILAAQIWESYFRDPHPASELALRRLTVFFGRGEEINPYSLHPFIEGAGGVDALATLLVKLVHYVLDSDASPEIKTRNLGGILSFSNRSKDDAWLAALRSHKFMSAMISVLLFVEPHIEVPTEEGLYQELFNQALHGYLRLSALNSSYTSVVEAVDAGILPLIASVISRNLEWTETGIRGIPLLSAPSLLPNEKYPREPPTRRYIRTGVKRKFDSGEHIPYKACDNVECGKILKKTDFKRCAGCAHHHYCSKECQIKDWRIGHRISCQRTHLRHVQVNVHTLDLNSEVDYSARERRSGGRIHSIMVVFADSRSQPQPWLLPVRSSTSEVHDRLFQLSQNIPPGTDSTSDLSPAVHRAVTQLINTQFHKNLFDITARMCQTRSLCLVTGHGVLGCIPHQESRMAHVVTFPAIAPLEAEELVRSRKAGICIK